MDATLIKPGKLIRTRNREWIVLPSNDKDLLRIKPLGGTESEITCIFQPFQFSNEQIEEVYFEEPKEDDIGDLQSAKLLYDSLRLSFRDASGPFRCLAKLNFTPRAYQMVPMIMALRQSEPVRLFIADDVGIGKTVESLMIARELLDRRIIKRFAVVCPPHLCEQWALEINEKFGLEPVVFRSSTISTLRRQTPVSENPFHYYPIQVVSIDYMKSSKNSPHFIQNCPELVIVDEIHTCSKGQGKGRQLRHDLIREISKKEQQHLVLLSATPHSGKPEQFQSILSFLDAKYDELELNNATPIQKQNLAKQFVQRRRADIQKWVSKFSREDNTPFPNRTHFEVSYVHSEEYLDIQFEILKLARKIARKDESKDVRKRLNYWTALGLIRGVMSSPKMGFSMLEKRAGKIINDEEAEELGKMDNPIVEDDFSMGDDNSPTYLLSAAKINSDQWKKLVELSKSLQSISGTTKDRKISKLIDLLKLWLEEGLHPIVYCRYINTAKYVGEQLHKKFGNKRGYGILTITSEDPDELRKQKVEEMEKFSHRILVATDCMSEGINLQDNFTAVVHYDLPWNPNRLEQREGRVDRFGQNAKEVKTALLYATNSPMDGILLNVLIKKAREIKKSIGISVPFPENNQSIMETITNAVLLKGGDLGSGQQLMLFQEDPDIKGAEEKIALSYKKIEEIEKATRSIFAQHSVRAQDIENDLSEAIRLIGDMETVENFVIRAVQHLGGQITKKGSGYEILKTGLPVSLHHLFAKEVLRVMFSIPLDDGFKYIARNHPLVDGLCQILIAQSRMSGSKYGVSRASVIRHSSIQLTTTICLFRVRNVIESIASKEQMVAEELHLWGYRGSPSDDDWLDEESCMKMLELQADAEVMDIEKKDYFEDAMEELMESSDIRDDIARNQAKKLIEAHDRFRQAVRAKKEFQVVEPILPMDIMGVYVFVPNTLKH